VVAIESRNNDERYFNVIFRPLQGTTHEMIWKILESGRLFSRKYNRLRAVESSSFRVFLFTPIMGLTRLLYSNLPELL